MGITDYYWEKNIDGHNWAAAHGLFMKPRDMAKIGLLVLNKGKWKISNLYQKNGLDLVQSASYHSDFRDPGYGYYWWDDVNPNSTDPSEIGAISAEGSGGQMIFCGAREKIGYRYDK